MRAKSDSTSIGGNLMKLSISYILAFIISLAFMSSTLKAEETAKSKEGEWKSNIEFGYVATSGNTKTTSINGGFSASYEVKLWKHSVDIKTIFGSAEDSTTSEVETNAERYFIEGKSDYNYSDKSYAFAMANYEDDRFSDNDYQTLLSVGRGLKIDTSDNSKLDLELGVGYRKTLKKETILLAEESISETIVRLAANYSWDITENSKFEQKLSSDIGEDDTVIKSYTGLSANFAKNLALKLSLTATHHSEVRGDTEKLDTVTAVTVVYNF